MNTGPLKHIVLEMANGDQWRLDSDSMTNALIDYTARPTLEAIMNLSWQTLEFEGATKRVGEDEYMDGDWEYSITRIYKQNVCSMTFVYDEPARMDWED